MVSCLAYDLGDFGWDVLDKGIGNWEKLVNVDENMSRISVSVKLNARLKINSGSQEKRKMLKKKVNDLLSSHVACLYLKFHKYNLSGPK